MSESAQQTTPTGREVLRSPGVTAFMVAQFTMTVGVMLQAAALGKQAYDISGRAADALAALAGEGALTGITLDPGEFS